MDRIDRYILRHLAAPFFAALLGALAILMLERMLRLIDLVGKSQGALAYVFDMLANLVPHYLGIALPAALFIACYVGYRRLSQTSELAAFSSLGRGLGRLAAPAMAVAVLLAILSAYVHSHLQPQGRYAYRTLGFLAANASIAAALESGAFVQIGDMTFMAEKPAPGESALARVFVHERREDGGVRTITSSAAALLETPSGDRSGIQFEDGLLSETEADGDRAIIEFERLDWPVDRSALGVLRPRGISERELTWPELLEAPSGLTADLIPERVASETHGRAARTLTVLLIPLLAIPLAIAGGRSRSAAPLALGVIALLFYIQSLKFAEGLVDLGRLPAAPAIWTPFCLFLIGVSILFVKAWRGVGFEASLSMVAAPRLRRRRARAAEPLSETP